jgi:cystathionine beta-lyase/cystathionine gamma-synthase
MAKDGKRPIDQTAFETRAVHAGESPDPTTRAHNLPIYQTATFSFETADEKEAAVDGALAWQPDTYFYTRTNNPTTAALEAKLASLEGAESAVASASGMAAVAAGLLAHLHAGDHLLLADDLFIISQILFAEDFPARGIEVTPVPISDLAAVRAAIRPNTKVIYAEVLSNPWMRVSDVPALAEIAHAAGALLIIDNTFLSPAVIRPLELGADLVLHATTKWIAGHGDALGGVVAGSKALVDPIRRQTDLLGGAASPFNSWLIARGARTLPLRIERASSNATALAAFLEAHPKVEWVRHPSLASHPDRAVADRVLRGAWGGMLSFKPRAADRVDPLDAMRAFADHITLFGIAVSLGEVDTLVYPMPKRGGIFRISVGIEAFDDIRADFDQALEHVR